jgi:chorismate-pyruvate lyase
LPEVVAVAAEDVPQPYHQLLVGNHDMTPTLEAFHGERLNLRLLERRQEGESYSRLVLLTLASSGRPVEFGAIVIDLQCFAPAARQLVLAEQRPLGSVLAAEGIVHASRPRAFIRVSPDPFIHEALGLSGSHELYGRRNLLIVPDNRVLADIIEILPPID